MKYGIVEAVTNIPLYLSYPGWLGSMQYQSENHLVSPARSSVLQVLPALLVLLVLTVLPVLNVLPVIANLIVTILPVGIWDQFNIS